MVDADVFFKTGLNTTIGGGMGAVGPVTVAGIPSEYHINVDHLPDPLPKIQLGLDPVTFNTNIATPKPLTMTLTPLEMRLTELPSVRAHVPADFSVGLSVLGLNLLCVRLCGEAQMITEPYRPNPCERCGGALTRVPSPDNG